jgi:hypothetical protein
MTDTDTQPPPDGDYAPEEWTYGGLTLGSDGKKWAVWYTPDPERRPLNYAPDKGTHYVVGCQYTVLARRQPRADGKGEQTWKRGKGEFLRQHPDPEWRAQVQATAYHHDQEIEADKLEKRAKRDPGALDDAMAPLIRVAATMPYAQRDALIAIVTRKIYQARPADATAPASRGERYWRAG